MVVDMNKNPLGVPQRETAGADTFSKYEYQYHWALCRIIDEHREEREYALFMEYHEDVVIANSLQSETAKFEFNQIKNIAKPQYNIDNLLKVKKHGDNSVLGKLISSIHNKPFKSRLTSINLIASCGFKFDLVDHELNLEVITIGNLSKQSIIKLKSSLAHELGVEELPLNLQFIIPRLGISEQQDTVIGKIAKMIADVFPSSYSNSQDIYRILIDDLHRKGIVKYNYNEWDDLLKKKALTSTQVSQVIMNYISLPKLQTILDHANDIASEIGLKYIEKRKMKQNLERIHSLTFGNPSSIMLKIKKSIHEGIDSISKTKENNLSIVINYVETQLPDKIKKDIGNENDIRDRIIYEIITKDNI